MQYKKNQVKQTKRALIRKYVDYIKPTRFGLPESYPSRFLKPPPPPIPPEKLPSTEGTSKKGKNPPANIC